MPFTLHPIQVVLALFALFALLRTWLQSRRRVSSRKELFLWSLFWVAVVVVVLNPTLSSIIAIHAGVGRGADLVLYLGMSLSFYLFFRTFARIEDIERQTSRLVRNLALEEFRRRYPEATGGDPAP